MNYRTEKINHRTKMGNVRKMGENRIIEQQRSDKNLIIIERRKKLGVNSDTLFFHTFRGKQNYRTTGYGKYCNRTFVLLNFRSIILALTVSPHNIPSGKRLQFAIEQNGHRNSEFSQK